MEQKTFLNYKLLLNLLIPCNDLKIHPHFFLMACFYTLIKLAPFYKGFLAREPSIQLGTVKGIHSCRCYDYREGIGRYASD